MVIIGENLLDLIKGQNICDPKAWDNFSISLTLGSDIFRCKGDDETTLTYGVQDLKKFYKAEKLLGGELSLAPGECVLAASFEEISMPLGYIGFLQTKGTLARMFVLAHCTDAHIEPGFTGCITLEICNLSKWSIKIPLGAPIAQLFISRCSMEATEGYVGKYLNSKIPTMPLPFASRLMKE